MTGIGAPVAVRAGVLALLVVLAAVPISVQAAVDPPTFEGTLHAGESATVTKTVDVPEVPRRLDLFLIVDLTGSYADDLPRIKALAPQIFDYVRSAAATSAFGLGSHVDFPFGQWGVSGEYGYRLDQQLTLDRSVWLNSVNAMVSRFGNDFPESQYDALYQAATGAGREMPTTTDGEFNDPGEIAPGQSAGFRPNATRVFAITTDSAFHNAGDPGGPFPYPGPSRDTVVNALNAATIRVVAIKAPGSTTQMDDVATATGGAITSTSSTSAEIGNAILRGLGSLNFDVTATEFRSCAPLKVEFTPPSHTNVPGNSTVTFEEKISVPDGLTPADLPPDGVVDCTIRFLAGESGIGVQQVKVKVVLNQPPDCSAVTPDKQTLFSPNHQFELITLSGATDPDDDPVTLTVKGVSQDEPLEEPGAGSGSTSPDAKTGPNSNSVYVRAERSGSGDGRVYAIEYEVSDGRGGTCTGDVKVAVPKSRNGAPAVDSGQTVDSFGP